MALVFLVASAVFPRIRVGYAVALAVAVGGTVAQPFGATSTRITYAEFAATRNTRLSTGGTHFMSVGGVPVVAFSIYPRTLVSIRDTGPAVEMRVRTWLGPLTNGSTVAEVGDFGLRGLEIWRTHSGAIELAESNNPGVLGPQDGYWRLGFGVTSVGGVVYWIVAPSLVVVAVLARRRRARRSTAPSTRVGSKETMER